MYLCWCLENLAAHQPPTIAHHPFITSAWSHQCKTESQPKSIYPLWTPNKIYGAITVWFHVLIEDYVWSLLSDSFRYRCHFHFFFLSFSFLAFRTSTGFFFFESQSSDCFISISYHLLLIVNLKTVYRTSLISMHAMVSTINLIETFSKWIVYVSLSLCIYIYL